MAFMPDQTELDSEPIELRPQSRSITARRSLGFAGANAQIANKLRQAADILATQGAHSFRTAAYRKAAESVLSLDTDLCTIAERGGRKALEAIPGVGVSIAGAIAEMLTTGRWTFLDHLSRPSRNQTRISNALRPRPYGLSWMICRFTSARIFPQRGCKLNEPNGFEPLRRVHDRIIRVLWPINFAHKRQRVRS